MHPTTPTVVCGKTKVPQNKSVKKKAIAKDTRALEIQSFWMLENYSLNHRKPSGVIRNQYASLGILFFV